MHCEYARWEAFERAGEHEEKGSRLSMCVSSAAVNPDVETYLVGFCDECKRAALDTVVCWQCGGRVS